MDLKSFNFYSSSKQDIINVLEKYVYKYTQINSKYVSKRNYEDREYSYEIDSINSRISNTRDLCDEEYSKIYDKFMKRRGELNSRRSEIQDEIKNKKRKVEDSIRLNGVIIPPIAIVITSYLASNSHLPEEFFYIIIYFIVIITFVYHKFIKDSIIKTKIEKIDKDPKIVKKLEKHNEKVEMGTSDLYDQLIKEARELYANKEKLEKQYEENRKSMDNKYYYDLDNLNGEFNIPNEIKGKEKYIYELLVKNRVNSFNEALDRLELEEHRRNIERIQEEQLESILESREITELGYEMAQSANEKLYNINKEMSNQMKEQQRSIEKAQKAAEKAEEAARDAEFAARYID